MQLFSGRMESSNSLFLAMAHWQLGHADEARRWSDQAVAWMDKNAPQNSDLLQFRTESAALLVISSQPRD